MRHKQKWLGESSGKFLLYAGRVFAFTPYSFFLLRAGIKV
jgi:hypothetical protein